MTNRKSRTPRIFLAALGLTVGLGAAAPQTAEACGGGWWPEIQIDHRVQGIATAEKQLNMGRYKDAAASVIRMIPHIRSYAWATSDTIINRSLRVLAVSTVRSDGKLDLGRQVPRELQNQWLGALQIHACASKAGLQPTGYPTGIPRLRFK